MRYSEECLSNGPLWTVPPPSPQQKGEQGGEQVRSKQARVFEVNHGIPGCRATPILYKVVDRNGFAVFNGPGHRIYPRLFFVYTRQKKKVDRGTHRKREDAKTE